MHIIDSLSPEQQLTLSEPLQPGYLVVPGHRDFVQAGYSARKACSHVHACGKVRERLHDVVVFHGNVDQNAWTTPCVCEVRGAPTHLNGTTPVTLKDAPPWRRLHGA